MQKHLSATWDNNSLHAISPKFETQTWRRATLDHFSKCFCTTVTIFQQLHQTAPESKGRGDCYYAKLKESSPAWKIMLVLSRIELTPSIFKAPNLTRQISILLFSSAKKLLHTINNKKRKKIKPSVQSCLGNFPCGIEGRNVSFELKWLQVLSSHGQDDSCDA